MSCIQCCYKVVLYTQSCTVYLHTYMYINFVHFLLTCPMYMYMYMYVMYKCTCTTIIYTCSICEYCNIFVPMQTALYMYNVKCVPVLYMYMLYNVHVHACVYIIYNKQKTSLSIKKTSLSIKTPRQQVSVWWRWWWWEGWTGREGGPRWRSRPHWAAADELSAHS